MKGRGRCGRESDRRAASLPHSVGSLRVSITLSPYVTPLSQLGLSTVSHSCLATVSQSHSSAVGKGPPSSHSRPLRSAYGEDEREERRTSEPDDERSGREKRKVMRVGYERNEETHSHHFSRLSLVPSCHSLSLRLTSSFPFAPFVHRSVPPLFTSVTQVERVRREATRVTREGREVE